MKMRPLAPASASPLNVCFWLPLPSLLPLPPLPPAAAAGGEDGEDDDACSALSVSHASRIADSIGLLWAMLVAAALAAACPSASSRSMVN